MREISLELRPSSTRNGDRQVDAWFISGGSGFTWLNTILNAGSSTRNLRFRAIGDPGGQAVGALVTGIDGPSGQGWLPYTGVAGRLFVPTASEFSPMVTDDELRDLFKAVSAEEFVWHPVLGLVAFESQQILQTSDLLSVPEKRAADWDHVNAGCQLNGRLISVVPEQQLTVDMVIESGRGDIGSDADQISDAPRSDDESSALKDLISESLKPFARAAKWMAGKAPAGATQPTWINSLGDWANQVLQHSMVNQSKRMNELKRLMSMLDGDPDKGLKYAIPFGGDATRGVATAGNNLVSHGVEYGGRLGGGGPASYWDMPYDVRAKLLAKYRHLAQRELSLGRFQRAAYIYAELLGDFLSAASVLQEGGYFREAAAVYRDKLKQEKKAAECLLRGGIWVEAIEVYSQLADWVTVAETYERIDDADAARTAWGKACEACIASGDYITAASLQESKLHDVRKAEKLLQQGWLENTNARQCLGALFDLYGRTDRHENSLNWMAGIVDDASLAEHQQHHVAEILADVSQQYPNSTVRKHAFVGSRQIVARQLAVAKEVDAGRRRFTSVLEKLLPGDRLLNRDCKRYLQNQSSLHRRSESARGGYMKLLDTIRLEKNVVWQVAICLSKSTVVAGFSRDSLVVASWDHSSRQTIFYDRIPMSKPRQGQILLVPHATEPDQALVQVIGSGFGFAYDAFAQLHGRVSGSSPPFGSQVIAAASSQNGTVWTSSFQQGAIEVRGFRQSGSAISLQNLPMEEGSAEAQVFMEAFLNDVVCVVISHQLFVMGAASELRADAVHPDQYVVDTASMTHDSESSSSRTYDLFQLPAVAGGCSAFHDAQSGRLAIPLEVGGVVHWIHTGHQQAFGAGLIDPVVTFMGNEDLLVADQTGSIVVYQTRNQQLKLKCSHEVVVDNVAAILPCTNPASDYETGFVLVRPDGLMDFFGYRG